ncbi:MAG: hypothetical protein UH249_05610 [Acutalibacteraceae bacterium]|nr:hypothetical protein [Acutalibacteraceae bacterium]
MKKKIAPVIITILVILFSLAYITLFVFLTIKDIILLPVSLVFIAVYLVVCIGIVVALRERIKEINQGDEDYATRNY